MSSEETRTRDPAAVPTHLLETAALAGRHEETICGNVSRARAEHTLPEEIGDYEVLRELARGGMGVVYLARCKGLERQVALKVLRADDSRDGKERFQTEARVIARLRHPNIVGIYEVGTCGERSFLAMDYIPGGSLRDALEQGPLDPQRAAEISRTVAFALAFAHERYILHRDVKPGNILLADEGPVLTDFGLAKDVGQLSESPTLSGQAIGTPAYMSPEQARGDAGTIDRRTDVYSLGTTLYEMLTGEPPFTGDSVFDLLTRLEQDPPPKVRKRRPEVDRDLETIVLTCLAKSPEHRYATARDLGEDLDRYLRHEPIEARRPGPIARARLWLRRHDRVAKTALISLVALIVVVVIEARVFIGRLTRDHEEMQSALARAERERNEARGARDRAARRLEVGARAAAQAQSALQAREWRRALVHYRRAFAHSPALRGALGFDAARAAAHVASEDPARREQLLADAASWLSSYLDTVPDRERDRCHSRTLESEALAPWREHPAFEPLRAR